METAGRMERAAMELETEGMSDAQDALNALLDAAKASLAGDHGQAAGRLAHAIVIIKASEAIDDATAAGVIEVAATKLVDELCLATGLTVEQIVEKVLADAKKESTSGPCPHYGPTTDYQHAWVDRLNGFECSKCGHTVKEGDPERVAEIRACQHEWMRAAARSPAHCNKCGVAQVRWNNTLEMDAAKAKMKADGKARKESTP